MVFSVGYLVLGIGCWVFSVGYSCWVFSVGYLVLGISCWVFSVGYPSVG